jgi:hypothetical protein
VLWFVITVTYFVLFINMTRVFFKHVWNFEIRNPKSETISNDKNSKPENDMVRQMLIVSRLRPRLEFRTFGHLILGFVSACPGATYLDDSAAHVSRVWARDFDIRISDFLRTCLVPACST